MKRLPFLYFAMLALLLTASLFFLSQYKRESQCSCVLGGHYEDSPEYSQPEDCLVHGKDVE